MIRAGIEAVRRRMSGNPLKQINNIYGYVRVSTDEQVKSGISWRRRSSRSASLCEKYNREVTEFFADEGHLWHPCGARIDPPAAI